MINKCIVVCSNYKYLLHILVITYNLSKMYRKTNHYIV